MIDTEPTNDTRAGWAEEALITYYGENRGFEYDRGNLEDVEDAIGDLMADLAHLAESLGLDPETLFNRAKDHYETEKMEEEAAANNEND